MKRNNRNTYDEMNDENFDPSINRRTKRKNKSGLSSVTVSFGGWRIASYILTLYGNIV